MSAPPAGDPRDLLAQLRETVAAARAMPFSASCLVNRDETLQLLDALGAALPDSLAAADALLAAGNDVLEEAHQQAEQLREQARAEAQTRLAETAAGAAATVWAQELRKRTEVELAAERDESENLVDSKLAHLEAVLVRTAILARAEAEAEPDAVAEVTARLGGLADEIDQMLLVVRRGRERMAGRHHMEELGEHLRAMDDAPDEPSAGLGTREELG
jgi:F0F1-type ATP synthase membrane subunit b/b'